MREDKLAEAFRKARADQPKETIEPTEEEARNGWTTETLSAYHADQRAAQAMRMDPSSLMRKSPPRKANSKFDPHARWRG